MFHEESDKYICHFNGLMCLTEGAWLQNNLISPVATRHLTDMGTGMQSHLSQYMINLW